MPKGYASYDSDDFDDFDDSFDDEPAPVVTKLSRSGRVIKTVFQDDSDSEWDIAEEYTYRTVKSTGTGSGKGRGRPRTNPEKPKAPKKTGAGKGILTCFLQCKC